MLGVLVQMDPQSRGTLASHRTPARAQTHTSDYLSLPRKPASSCGSIFSPFLFVSKALIFLTRLFFPSCEKRRDVPIVLFFTICFPFQPQHAPEKKKRSSSQTHFCRLHSCCYELYWAIPSCSSTSSASYIFFCSLFSPLFSAGGHVPV